MLYLCDEAFFTGTAAEITPIRSIDDKPTRTAGAGPVTQLIQDRFFGLFDASSADDWGWLEPVHETAIPVADRVRETERQAS